jgi:hypothetical protein
MSRESYAFDCIAASGFAVMSPAVAYELRPDLWACAADCARNMKTRDKIPGTRRLTVIFEGLGPVLVLTRSLDQLEQRLAWIVGRAVLDLKPAEPEVSAAGQPNMLHKAANAKEAERLEQVRKLAVEDPPSHDCSRRREILEARRELGMAA